MAFTSFAFISTQFAILSIPALPGAQNNSSHLGDFAIAQHRECSRPPEPTTKIFIVNFPLFAHLIFNIHNIVHD